MGKWARTRIWAQVRPKVHTSRSHSAVLFPFIVIHFFFSFLLRPLRPHNTPAHIPIERQRRTTPFWPNSTPNAAIQLLSMLSAVYVSNALAHTHTHTPINSTARYRLRYYFGISFRSLWPSISPSQLTDSAIHLFVCQSSWCECVRTRAVRTHTTMPNTNSVHERSRTHDAPCHHIRFGVCRIVWAACV